MEATVVGAVIGATIQVVLQQLLSLPLDQIKVSKKDQLAKLKTSFDMVNDYLHDASMQHVTDRALKRWMRNLEALAFEAETVLDEINYHLLSKKLKKLTTPTKTKDKVRSFLTPSKNPISKLDGQIKEIINKLEQSKKDATGLGLQARLACVRGPDSASMETDSFSVDPIFCGREGDVSKIVEMLVTVSPTERELSVLSIIGMGGLGKTTLSRKVFGDQKIISHFGNNRVWVHVPRKFDGIVLLKNILTSRTTDNVEHCNREALLNKLQNTLGRERYLLVLDDVWNEEREKWEDFVSSLSGISSAVGNRVVVTTRSHEVSSIVKTLYAHELKGLPEDDCWSIIKAKTSKAEDDLAAPYEKIGRSIAQKCQGLPLAAKVVGGLLCNKSREEWIAFEKNWFSNFGGENPISKILKLSFDNLSSPLLKKCFAYCSIFPKGYPIEKEEMIQLWMAEGFLIQTDQNNNMETTGRKFFSILLQNSLLQVAYEDFYGNVIKMHDLVHDLASSILCADENVHHRYIGYNSSGDIESLSIRKEEARYVRTLFFNGNVSENTFSNFKSLRTLILLDRQIVTLPTSINELIHLRYLDTSETMIRYFPDTIGELYHLETLRPTEYLVYKLPNSLKYLISLRHLHIDNCIALPPEIGRLTSLQTLPHYHVREEKGCGISELGSLKNLKGKLTIHNLENVRDKDEALSAELLLKTDIIELTLDWPSYGTVTGCDEAKQESVLEGLQPHPNLKRLTINQFKGRRLLLKMEALNNLMSIELQDCKQVEEVPMLGHLPHLKSLCLHKLENVRSIDSSFYNIDNCSHNQLRNGETTILVFPALERLDLSYMSSLIEWAEVELPPPSDDVGKTQVVVFPRLECLRLTECRQLMSAPSHFPCLKKLKMEEMDSGMPLENISRAKLSSLTHLEIIGIKDLECLPEGLFSNNQNLLELSIRNCENLKSIRAKGHEVGFISLRRLTIYNCKGLTHFPIEMIESSAPSLVELYLGGLITSFSAGFLNKMSRLESLTIADVPRFSTKEIEIGSPSSSLEILIMSHCSSWDDNVSFSQAVDAILQTSRVSLQDLFLTGMSHWECLPDQIQHLTCLWKLELYDFGMEALPEWFGNFSSLESLWLMNCKKLRHMASKEAMQRLTKLIKLEIEGCRLLLKSNNEEGRPKMVDSEWHKLSHIPSIYYGAQRVSN